MSVLITGAGGGLGSEVCRVFTEAQLQVVAVDRAWKEVHPYRTIDADLSTAEGAAAMVEQALALGPIVALIHLVGGFSGGKSIADTDDKTWDLMINVNLRVAVNTIRAVLRPMMEARKGRIVAIGSRAAVEPSPKLVAYAVSKAALVALVKNTAAEGKDFGITANVVLPSTIDTAANRRAMPQSDFSKWVTPESIAKTLLWLTSDAASDVSGAVIPIYGRA
jgi:NAD(P)-dependent dehydrogenase (short-subunit alcohol dehydrogenase family)